MSATQKATDVRLRLELLSVPASVGLIRSVIRTLARAEKVDAELVDDMRSAISEACNNVVLHAYPSAPGPLVFSLSVSADWVEAIVRDQGSGIRPGASRERGLGMGVALINSLADRTEFESSQLGTEVRMRFRRAPERLTGVSPEVWALTDPALADPGASDAPRDPSD